MGVDNGTARTTQAILEDALHEMHERERRLQPFIDEIKDVRKGIKTLERALEAGGGCGSASVTSGGPGLGVEVIRHLKESADPLTKDQLGERLGTKLGLHMVLGNYLKSGKVIEVEGGYGLPIPATADME